MKKEDILLSLWYVIVITLIINLIFTVTSIRVMNRVLEEIDAKFEVQVATNEVYAYPMKLGLENTHIYIDETLQDAPSEPVEAPEPEIVPEVVYFDVPLDEALQEHIIATCEEYGVEPELIVGMIYKESTYNIEAIGDGGNSYGLMQIQPKWHKDRMSKLSCEDLLDPYQNVTVGVDLISELLDQRGSVEWALMAYNGGPSYANDMVKAGKVSEYVEIVLGKMDELKGF